jgi:hypothetical protein
MNYTINAETSGKLPISRNRGSNKGADRKPSGGPVTKLDILDGESHTIGTKSGILHVNRRS